MESQLAEVENAKNKLVSEITELTRQLDLSQTNNQLLEAERKKLVDQNKEVHTNMLFNLFFKIGKRQASTATQSQHI